MLSKQQSFEILFKTHYRRLYDYATYLLGADLNAADIVSEAFSKLWTDYDNVHDNKPENLLFIMVRNSCFDTLRRQNSASRYAQAISHDSTIQELGIDHYNELLESVLEVIDSMPPQTRFAIEQNYLNEMSYKELSQIMGLSVSGVKKHVMKGLDIIRQKFQVSYKKGKGPK